MLIGDPLGGQHGVLAYAVQSAWGTPATPNLSVGMVSLDSNENPDAEELFGVGSASAQFVRYKGQKNEATVAIKAVQNIAFLTQGIRASGALPILTVAFGLQDDAGTRWAKVYQDCKINRWECELQEEGVLSASATLFLGKQVVSAATSRPTALTPYPFQWIDATVSVGGVAKVTKALRLSLEHGIERKYPILAVAAAANEARLPYRLREGKQQVSGEVTLYQTLGVSRQTDVPAATTLGIALVSRADATNTATFAASGVVFGEEHHTGDEDADQEFVSRFIATGLALT